MSCPAFVLLEDLVSAHHEDLYKAAEEAHFGRVYSGKLNLIDHLLDHTGDVLIRLGTYLKTEPPAYSSPSCEVEA